MNNIPLYIHSEIHMYYRIYIIEYIMEVYVTHHIFFIHSPIDGHLGFFCFLAIVSNAAVNMGYIHLFKLVFSFSLENFLKNNRQESHIQKCFRILEYL